LLEDIKILQNTVDLGELTLRRRYLIKHFSSEYVDRVFGILCHLLALFIELVQRILQDLDYFIKAVLDENLACQARDKGLDVF
jgi:hypothetical protein